MIKIIKKIDLFGKPVSLLFNKKKEHKTLFGASLTILVIILSCIAGVYMLQEMFLRNKPNLFSFQQPIEQTQKINLMEHKFAFALKVLKMNKQVLPDPKIFTIKVKQKSLKENNDNWESNQIEQIIGNYELEQCKFEQHFIFFENQDHQKDYQNQFDNTSLLCIKTTDLQQNIFLSSGLLSYNDTILEIEFSQCIDQSFCASQQEIEREMEQHRVEIFISDTILEHQNYIRPEYLFFQKVPLQYNFQQVQQVDVQLQRNSIITNDGMLTDRYRTQHFLGIKQINERQQQQRLKKNDSNSQKQMGNEVFIKLSFSLFPIQVTYQREYLKLQNSLGIIGGLIKIIMMACMIVARPVATLSLKSAIVNQLFDFEKGVEKSTNDESQSLCTNEESPEKQKQKDVKPQTPIGLDNVNVSVSKNNNSLKISNQLTLSNFYDKSSIQQMSNDNIRLQSRSVQFEHILKKSMQNEEISQEDIFSQNKKLKKISSKQLKSKIQRIIQKIIHGEKVIAMSIYDYVKYVLQCFRCCYDEKKTHIIFSHKKVTERLDLSYILRKLAEVDKLKVLFLDQNQIQLFDYLPKPKVKSVNSNQIDSSNNQTSWSLLHSDLSDIERLTDACKAFIKVQNKKIHSSLDKKLIEIMDPRIKNYFEKTRGSDSLSFSNNRENQTPIIKIYEERIQDADDSEKEADAQDIEIPEEGNSCNQENQVYYFQTKAQIQEQSRSRSNTNDKIMIVEKTQSK